MQEIKQRIGYIIIIIAALVVIAVTWVRFDEPSFDAPLGDAVSDENIDTTPETELPDFAYVEVRDGERVLVNERDGYEVVLEENWVPEYYTNVVEIFVRDNYPSGEMTASFDILKNDKTNSSLELMISDRLERYNNDCTNCYVLEDIQTINNNEIAILKDTAAITSDYYLLLFLTDKFEYELFADNFDIKEALNIVTNNNFN